MINASQFAFLVIVFILAEPTLSSEWWSVTSSTLSIVLGGLILAAVSAGRMYRRTREKEVDGRFKELDHKHDIHGSEINDTRRILDQLYQDRFGKLPDYPRY